MSRKDSTGRKRSPRKAELLAALQAFTEAVKNAGGILIIESGTTRRAGRNLDTAYRNACRVLSQVPEPIVKDSPDNYADQAAYLLRKHDRLLDLARRRGYSTKALVGLALSAELADGVAALPFR